MKFQQLLEEVKHEVISYFDVHHDPELAYHNLKHTKDVVAAATQIANHYQLSDEEFFIVLSAAWFHDTGYFVDKSNHEVKSSENATHFLKQKKVDNAVIDRVNTCIMATEMPQKPTNLLEEILCDADLFHLGTDDFREKSKMMRKELEACRHVEIDKETWRIGNIALLESHHYFTDYCRLLLNDQKEKNLAKLKDKQTDVEEKAEKKEKAEEKEVTETGHTDIAIVKADKDEHDHHDKKHKEKDKDEKPEKGIETMFRISSSNHQRLSNMADNKAHIMITVNSIILSAIISLVLRKLDEHSNLLIPTFMLLSVSLLTMIFSILATRPSIPGGVFTHDDIEKKSVNLLFFGNFYRMPFEQYSEGMEKMMDDKDFLYGSLIRDNYSQGVVLGKKYRLLRASYNIFMFGLIISVIAYAISSML
ncbi:Predicted metal-dependent phosphohydrolase, HD superfamily [Mucilaginibacter lappiensis]|uniref:Metal-dependent HD superfamily phosphohydrolase n=1 Tax=Mucilaginibacter lappiensis TaxID=354630 RepID=A0ABR6PDV8_9SPHI|nr:Pycsar system effector family protein [Mucilaginibacter lappiensis]MBB6107957.1 putative metal-dependent HD superfamily phosphohydrolase [Mucilaginibacter lappiensis]SIP91247.1 Predicted metal-dependent phosphohydrolase, HD superfamily [Mucilaginibacter lappiensis]